MISFIAQFATPSRDITKNTIQYINQVNTKKTATNLRPAQFWTDFFTKVWYDVYVVSETHVVRVLLVQSSTSSCFVFCLRLFPIPSVLQSLRHVNIQYRVPGYQV